jgi:thioredoxin 1
MLKGSFMNQKCLAERTKLHEQNQHAGSTRLIKNNFMKRNILLSVLISSLLLVNCKSENTGVVKSKNTTGTVVAELTNETFKKMVFNYDVNKEWKYEGNKPAIIDFYADWCAPCRKLSPLVDEIAKEYSGKIVVYKVDTVKEKLLAQGLGITGLPTLLFIPANGKPKISMGLIPREELIKTINEVLLIK